jgi:hypothetical protein
METQNVSAQLFAKQLPVDSRATSYGCQNDFNTTSLTTCVDPVASDAALENAFQKQLDLTEYYKSPMVFDTMKRQFTDQTMDAVAQSAPLVKPQPVVERPVVQEVLPVGPRDFLNKETFGETTTSSSIWTFMLILILLIILSIIGLFSKFLNPFAFMGLHGLGRN